MASGPGSDVVRRRSTEALPGVAIVVALATLLVVPRMSLGATTHAGSSFATATADAAAGLALALSAVAVRLLHPGSAAAVLAGCASMAWFAQDWAGWLGGPPLARSVAMIVAPLFLVLVTHLVLAGPSGHVARRPGAVLGLAYGALALVSIGHALFRDPFLDPYCWSNCHDNSFLIVPLPALARWLDVAAILVLAALGLYMATSGIRRVLSATPAARRAILPVLLPSSLLGAASAAHALALLRWRLETPQDPVFSALFEVRAWATAAIGVGLAWVAVRGWRVRGAITRLAADLARAPTAGALGPALARATGDPSLRVVYPLNGGRRYVDAFGAPVLAPAPNHPGVTTIRRGQEEVALVTHAPEVVGAELLRAEMGTAAGLAVENERLQAEVMARLRDLRTSRARLVEAGDAERRRLERNLHDGAQQRLLALSYDLRLAQSGAEAAGHSEQAAALRTAGAEALRAVDDLRDLAHGIYPAILTESGLEAAVWTLADRAPLPVEIRDIVEGRFPDVVERTAFVVVSEMVEAAQRRAASHLGVRLTRSHDDLVVEVEGAGPGPFVHVGDRVGALGGRIEDEDGVLRAVIPCA